VEYVNGKDDAILYYPLVESGGIVAKRECRRLGRMFCHGGSEIHVECLYNGFIPPGRWAGSEFELCISLETFELA
jgi:hypothetical protein